MSYREIMRAHAKQELERAITAAGSKAAAARLLSLNRTHFFGLLHRYGVTTIGRTRAPRAVKVRQRKRQPHAARKYVVAHEPNTTTHP